VKNPKLSLQERRFLADQVCKYLKYLTHSKTASGYTSTSYANDLTQFVFGSDSERILYTSQDGDDFFHIESDSIVTAKIQGNLDVIVESLVHTVLAFWAPLSPASRNRKFTVLRGFLAWLYEQRLITSDWQAQIRGPKVPQKIPHFLSLDEVIALFKALNEQPEKNHSTVLLVSLLYGGGLRVSEACAMKWTDLDKSKHAARLLGKGGRERLVILPDLVWTVIGQTPETGRYLFGEEALSTRKAFNMVRKAGANAGLQSPLNPHALRHSFATHLLSSGTDLRVLQELLGHKSLTATQKYTHLSMDHLARAMETFHPLSASKLKKPRPLD
jgi:site-specific recombinase XerD